MAPTKRKAVSLDTKQNILEDSRHGFKVSALVKKCELAPVTLPQNGCTSSMIYSRGKDAK